MCHDSRTFPRKGVAPASILITGPLVMTIHTCSALHDECCNKSASAGHENTIMIQIYFHLMSPGLLLVICPLRRPGPGRSPIVSSSHQKSVGHHRSQGSHHTQHPFPCPGPLLPRCRQQQHVGYLTAERSHATTLPPAVGEQ